MVILKQALVGIFIKKELNLKGKAKVAAVEQLFDVKVANVRTINVNGKSKRMGTRKGRRKDWKKAYVSLEQGHEIDLASIGA